MVEMQQQQWVYMPVHQSWMTSAAMPAAQLRRAGTSVPRGAWLAVERVCVVVESVQCTVAHVGAVHRVMQFAVDCLLLLTLPPPLPSLPPLPP